MKEDKSQNRTPLETVLETLYSLSERIPRGDNALQDINKAIKIISRGFLYDDVDIDGVDNDEEEKDSH